MTEGTAALRAPRLRELGLMWARSLPPRALDLLDERCPHWRSVVVTNGKTKYVHVGRGERVVKEEAQAAAS